MTETPEPSHKSPLIARTEAAEPPETPPKPATGTARARFVLRISMVVMALAIVAFAYFTPLWIDRGLTKVNEDRLRGIAEDTARKINANGWSIQQSMKYAQGQSKLGTLDTRVDILIADAAITVRITGTAASANPFASLTGGTPVNRIEVEYTHRK